MEPDYSVYITLDWLQTPLPCWLTVGVPETLLSLALPLPDPGEHPWPPHQFADEAAGACYSHTGGSANPLAAPRSVSDGGPARAGLSEQQIDMKQTPGERTGATTIRKMSATPLRASAVITEKGQWHPSVGGLSVPQGGGRCMAPHPLRLRPWHWLWSYDPTDRNKCTPHTSNVEWSSSQGLHMQSSEHITRWQYTQRLNTTGLCCHEGPCICGQQHSLFWF